MPLHREGEARGFGDVERLHRAVRGGGLDRESLAEAVDALGVKRVDLHDAHTEQPVQQTAFAQTHLVGRSVLQIQGLRIILPVVHASWNIVNFLVQATAEDHVHLLDAAADGEHRQAGVDGRAHQRQGGGVTMGIVQGAFVARIATVVVRLHIRRTSGEQQAVQSLEQLRDGKTTTERGYQQRHAAGGVGHGGDVLFAYGMKHVRREVFAAGGNADDGFYGAHGGAKGQKTVVHKIMTRPSDPSGRQRTGPWTIACRGRVFQYFQMLTGASMFLSRDVRHWYRANL